MVKVAWLAGVLVLGVGCGVLGSDPYSESADACEDYAGCELEAACAACSAVCDETCAYAYGGDTGIGYFLCGEEDYWPGDYAQACDTGR